MYDAIIVGGGHNGLTAAAYLAKNGLRALVCERRNVLGGAAVSEQMVPGFTFSRASYLLSLIRPQVISELDLKRHGLVYYRRNPSSFTPIRTGEHLLLGSDHSKNIEQIAKFSQKDADHYAEYEEWLNGLVDAVDPLLDVQPLSLHQARSQSVFGTGSSGLWTRNRESLGALYSAVKRLGISNIHDFYSIFTSPASKILRQHFESEPLLSTLATDAVIGANMSPDDQGSAYVLLHHVMGSLDGVKGAWAYVSGGMGAVSASIASAAKEAGAEIRTEAPVKRILTEEGTGGKRRAVGVELGSGEVIRSRVVLSNATPHITFERLLEPGSLTDGDMKAVRAISYASMTTKINLAIDKIPNFKCQPNANAGVPMPHHQATIHLGCESLAELTAAHIEAQATGRPSTVPMIEMCIPSVLDDSIAPPGKHVVTLFIQYTPFSYFATSERGGTAENAAVISERKSAFLESILGLIDSYAPGFSSSVIGSDILTPPDLEDLIGLTGGNIFHGALGLDQLWWTRPTARFTGVSTPIDGLYGCGSGVHPGGGVSGAPGRIAGLTVAKILKK